MIGWFSRLSLLVLAMLAGTATAHAQQIWQATEYTDDAGNRVGAIVFGTPETDDQWLIGTCSAATPAQVALDLYIDPGFFAEGQQGLVYFRASSLPETSRMATFAFNGMVGVYPRLVLPAADPIWQTFIRALSIEIGVEGTDWLTISLRGSANAFARFGQICDSIPGTAPPGAGGNAPAVPAAGPTPAPAGAQALIGPLFTVQGAPVRAFAGPNGAEIAPVQAGTELMATNRTSSREGFEIIEVMTQRGLGNIFWVPRQALTPISGGASEYQNLNQVANLVIRAEPRGNAGSVGAIPPNARGIFDQGQRSGSYVLIRYGNTTGWASHDYLLPLLPQGATAVAPPPGQLTPAQPGAGAPPPGQMNPAQPGAGAPPPGQVNPGAQAPAFDPSSVAAYYVGAWVQTSPAGGCNGGCKLTVTDNAGNGTLTFTSGEGWTAVLNWGADGDPYYATGSGLWTAGAFAGSSVSLDVITDGTTMRITMSTDNNGTRELVFLRP